jgi:hypothetical protein
MISPNPGINTPKIIFLAGNDAFERVFHVSRLDKRRFEFEVAEVT